MKTGRTLTELAAELTRQRESKRDFVADTRALNMTSEAKLEVDDCGIMAIPQIRRRGEAIRRAMERGRRSWEQYLKLQDAAVYQIFDDAANEINRRMAAAEVDGKLPPRSLKPISDEVDAQEKVFRRRFSASVKRGISNSVDAAIKSMITSIAVGGVKWKFHIGSSFIGKDGNLRRFDITKERYIDSAWYRMNRRAVNAVLDWKPDKVAFSYRVWDLGHNSKREIMKVVNQGVVQGRSAAGISRDIRHMLRMPDTLRGKVLKKYHPGAGVYKSAYKNAMRLARTELNQAFWEGTRQYVKSKSWLDGYIWRVGNVDACELCMPHEGEFFTKDETPEQPHPQCMCRLDPHIKEDPVPTEDERAERISQLEKQRK